MRLLPTVLLVLALVGTGCGDPDGPPDGAEDVGSLVARWSQSDHEQLGEQYGDRPDGLVGSDAERDELLAVLPDGNESAAVRAVDLTDELLVVGSYHRCVEQSRVLVDGAEVWLDVYVAEEDQDTDCAQAPLQVEVWSVPRDELDAEPTYRS
jgi:hypothetical protein